MVPALKTPYRVVRWTLRGQRVCADRKRRTIEMSGLYLASRASKLVTSVFPSKRLDAMDVFCTVEVLGAVIVSR